LRGGTFLNMSVSLRLSYQQAFDLEDYKGTARYLSQFQIEKLTYFFYQFFDNDHNGVIEAKDFAGLNERLRRTAGWSQDSEEYRGILDMNRVFFECLLDQVKKERECSDLEHKSWDEAMKPSGFVVTSINLLQWLNMWGRLCNRAAGIAEMPIWVQLLPDAIFKVMGGNEKPGEVTYNELRNFYHQFTGLNGEELDATSKEGYRAMTAGGDYALTTENFKLLFANFLLGKTIYGPGKFIFGCFDNSDMHQKYQVIYNVDE